MGPKSRRRRLDEEESFKDDFYQHMVDRFRRDLDNTTFSERRSSMGGEQSKTILEIKEKDLTQKKRGIINQKHK